MLASSRERARSVDAAALYEDLRQELIGILRAAPFEILRALSGRRSLAQIEGLDSTGARAELAPRVSRYPLPVTDLREE